MSQPTPRPRCPAVQGIEVLQEKWVLHIVHALLTGPKGFNAIGREVGGCNPTTLTQRLTRLETLGLIVKTEGDGTCRACYRLTDAGAKLEGVIGAIHRWADAHLVPDGVSSGATHAAARDGHDEGALQERRPKSPLRRWRSASS